MNNKESWPRTKGLVYSVEWCDRERNHSPHYAVVYSYRVGDERYRGSFRDFIPPRDGYFRRDDEITIAYNPEAPARSFYPDAKSDRLPWIFAAIGLVAGSIALLVLFLNQHAK